MSVTEVTMDTICPSFENVSVPWELITNKHVLETNLNRRQLTSETTRISV